MISLANFSGRAARCGGWSPSWVARRCFMSTNGDVPTVDVAIVGGGVVGAALAARLGSSQRVASLRVAVIEPQPPAHTLADCATLPPDARVFAITPSSQSTLLAAGGAWEKIAATRAPIFDSMQIWDALGPGFTRFLASHSGDKQIGWIVENRLLQVALFDVLQRMASNPASSSGAHVSLHTGAGLKSLWLPPVSDGPPLPDPARPASGDASSPHALAQLELTDGTKIRARLVVGADGAQSAVRAAARIGTYGWDYDQRAVVATVETDTPHSTAWQRFLPEGPVAVLPLWGRLSSIVWSTTHAHAETLTSKSLSPEAFTRALNAALTAPPAEFQAAVAGGKPEDGGPPLPFGGMGGRAAHAAAAAASSSVGPDAPYSQARDALPLDPLTLLVRAGAKAADALAAASSRASGEAWQAPPRITATVSPRLSFPLRWSTATSYVRPRLALIGDAAHTVHPLAGQGLNLGLGDAEELAVTLAQGAAAGADPGSLAQLRRYEAARARHNLLMMGALDGVKRAFTSKPGCGPGGLPVGAPLLEPWVVARNLGLSLLHGASPLKSAIAKFAMGGGGGGGGAR